MDKSMISSLKVTLSVAEWAEVENKLQNVASDDAAPGCTYTQIILKINSVYSELPAACTRRHHADSLLSICCRALLRDGSNNNYLSLDSKQKISTAKVLSHLSVKTLKVNPALCVSLCEVLLLIVGDSCLDESPKDRQSIAGYVYKSLWNAHSSSNSKYTAEDEFQGRIMALQLAVSGTFDQHIHKLSQQLTVTLAGVSAHDKYRGGLLKGLTNLRKAVDVAVKRSEHKSLGWKYLYLYVSCMQVLYSHGSGEDLPELQVPDELESYGSVCRHLLEYYTKLFHSEDLPTLLRFSQIFSIVNSCSNQLELQPISALITSLTKLITAEQGSLDIAAKLTWKQILAADACISRRQMEVLTDQTVKSVKHYVSRQLQSVTLMIRADVEMLSECGLTHQLSDSLSVDTDALRNLNMSTEVEVKTHLTDLVNEVGRFIQLGACRVLSPADKHSPQVQAIKQLAEACLSIIDPASHTGLLVLLQRQICDFLVKQSAYTQALNMFGVLSKIPKTQWDCVLTDWIKIKKKARLGADDSIFTRVLAVDIFKSEANQDEIIDLIFREYSEFSIREGYYAELDLLLSSMRSHAVTSTHMALYYLCQAELNITLNKDISLAESCITKGLAELTKNVSIYCNDIKAQLYVWQYIIAYRHHCDMDAVSTALTDIDYQPPAATYKSESKLQLPLDKALQLWAESADRITCDTDSAIYSQQKTSHCLEIVAHSFYMSKRLHKVLETSKLCSALLSQTPDSVRLLHVDALVILGDINSAHNLLNDLTYTDSIQHHLQLLKAKVYIHSNKVERAVEILEDLQYKQSRQSLDSAYISLSAHCTILDTMMSCTNIQTKNTLCHYALYCQRDHASLFSSISTHPIKNYSLKLKYLDAVLHSYITLGKVNMFIGSVREASCFLLAAKNMSQLLSVPLRSAEVRTCLAKLDCFLDDFTGAEAHLRHTNTALTSEISLFTTLPPPPVSTPVCKKASDKPSRKDLNKVKKSHLFGFESDDSGDESFSIKQPNSAADSDNDDEYKIPTYGTNTARDVTASPSFNKARKTNPVDVYKTWAPYAHPSQCTCTECQDHMLHVSHLDMIITSCQLKYKSGSVEDAEILALQCQRFCSVVKDKGMIRKSQIAHGITAMRLQLSIVMIKCYLTTKQYTLIQKEWDSLSKDLSTHQSISYLSMLTSHIRYITYIPRVIKYFQAHLRSGVEDLNTKLDSLKLNEGLTSSPLQPIRTENKPGVAPPSNITKAPRKTRRVAASKMAKLAFDDSDNEENIVNSVSKVKRSEAQHRSASPLAAAVLSKIKSAAAGSRANKKSITVFCDEDGGVDDTPDAKLQPKKSAKNRKQKPASSAEPEQLLPVRTRRTRIANRETLRADTIPEHNTLPEMMSDAVAVTLDCDSDQQVSPPNHSSSSRINTTSDIHNIEDDIELLRGDDADTASRPSGRSRKYSDAESMRSSVPMRSISPPELISSPTSGNLSTSPLADNADQQESIADMIGKLTEIWTGLSDNPPYELYRQVCQALAVLHYNESDNWKSAFYLTESQAITFTHKSHLALAQKSRAQIKEGTKPADRLNFELPTSRNLANFKSTINSLPQDWVVCNISVITEPGSTTVQQIYITRMQKNHKPVVMLAQNIKYPQEVWAEFEDILKGSKDSMSETERSAWWEKRRDIDKQLKALLERLSKELGVCRSALLGLYSDRKSRQHVEKCTDRVINELKSYEDVGSIDISTIEMLVSGSESLTADEICNYILTTYPQLTKQNSVRLSSLIKEGQAVVMDTRAPVILCLDKFAHRLSWESIPYLSEHPMSRMPSVYAVQSYLQVFNSQAKTSVYSQGINGKKCYYVLNPADNLPATEGLFKPIFASKKTWKGITSQKPTPEEFKHGLTNHDIFIFLGHGNGAKFLKGRDLNQLDCEAAVLLMGCSSGAFDSRGDMEPAGIIYDYHIAKCPSVLACLWDVTDKDIDRFTKSLLKTWLSQDEDKKWLSDEIPAARRACKLKYLVGSASVVYGLPVYVK